MNTVGKIVVISPKFYICMQKKLYQQNKKYSKVVIRKWKADERSPEYEKIRGASGRFGS